MTLEVHAIGSYAYDVLNFLLSLVLKKKITRFLSSPNLMQESRSNIFSHCFSEAVKMLQRLFFHHIKTSQLICEVNQLSGSYLI